MLPEAIARREQAFGWTHASTLHARTSLAGVQVTQGELQAAEHTLPALLEDLRAAMPGSAADLSAALRHRSYALTKRGEVEPAIADLHEALSIARQHFGEASRHALTTQALLGNTLGTFGRIREAIAVLEPAVRTAREAFGSQRPHGELAQLEGHLATNLIGVDRLAEAEDLLRHVLADLRALDGRDTIRTRLTCNMLAVVRAKRGAVDEAIALMREAMEAESRLSPVPTVDTGTMTSQLGEMLVSAGRFDEGLAHIDEADAIVLAAGGAGQEFPAVRRAIRRAGALLAAARFEAALSQATSVFDRTKDSDSWISGVALNVKIGALRGLHRLEEADGLVPEMLRRVESAESLDNRARAYCEVAATRIDQGRSKEAGEFAQRALDLLLPTQVHDSALLCRARDLICEAETAGGV